MTEKIINGIDVSECCFYNNGKCDNPNGMACNCINNAVCYFKELKRLEQENKDLKKQIESDKGLITVGGKQQYQYLQKIDELEQENKKLKEENKTLNYQWHKQSEIGDEWYKIAERYRSALEEIREMTKKYDAEVGDTIIANPIQDCYDIYCKINEALDKG